MHVHMPVCVRLICERKESKRDTFIPRISVDQSGDIQATRLVHRDWLLRLLCSTFDLGLLVRHILCRIFVKESQTNGHNCDGVYTGPTVTLPKRSSVML